MYELNTVYIWQNLRQYSQFNGEETMVLEVEPTVTRIGEKTYYGWKTDTDFDLPGGHPMTMYAEPGQLRRKHPPTGEQSITELFKVDHHVSEPAHV